MKLLKCDRCGNEVDTLINLGFENICRICNEAEQEEELKEDIIKGGYVPFEATVRDWNDGKIIWVPKSIRNIIKSNQLYRVRLYEVQD